MIIIQPKYLSLSDLLKGRLFEIPQYQRAYSWGPHQREDLFEDIKKTHEKGQNEGHFMAAVVCLLRKKQTLGTDDYDVMEVVDGQQRLTTLIILLKSIELRLDRSNKAEERLARELGELLVKPDGDELLLLQTNHDGSHYFADFLRKGSVTEPEKATTIADTQILLAIKECNEFVEQWVEDGETLTGLATLLKNRLFFLLHEINDEKTVYTVFEVLNSRGLDVSWLDRLKSIMMGGAFELKKGNPANVIKDLHNKWRDIYGVIGLRQGLSTEALRFAATLFTSDAPSRPLGEEGSVDVLRKGGTGAKEIRDVATWLLRVTKACDEVIANSRINAVTRISQARLLATAIHLRDDINKREKNALLERWEKVSFRIYGMMRHDARTRVGEYVRLAWRVVQESPSVKEIDAAIGDIGWSFPIGEAVTKMRKANSYEGWERELRYFMFRFEEHLVRVQKQNFSNEQWQKIWMVSSSESIEHVWAKSTAPETYKHRLGNLLLLPPKLNSKLQAKDAKEKVDPYRKTGLLIASDVADTIKKKGWSKTEIEEREEQLLSWAATEWAD